MVADVNGYPYPVNVGMGVSAQVMTPNNQVLQFYYWLMVHSPFYRCTVAKFLWTQVPSEIGQAHKVRTPVLISHCPTAYSRTLPQVLQTSRYLFVTDI